MGKPLGSAKAAASLHVLHTLADIEQLSTPAMTRLTKEFMERRSQLLDDSIEAVLRLGAILESGARELKQNRGAYTAWLRTLHLAKESARRWRAVARLARRDPAILDTWKVLGVTKLYHLASLPDGAAPASNPATLPRINREAFVSFTAPHVHLPGSATPGRRAHGLAMRVESYLAVIDSFDPAGIQNEAQKQRLAHLLKRLEDSAKQLARKILNGGGQ